MTLQPAQFQQLQMFMKPSEMRAMPDFEFSDLVRSEDFTQDEDVEHLRSYKLGEADAGGEAGTRHPSLTNQILEEGVKTPVVMHHTPPNPMVGRGAASRLANGHHRFFVQERRERQGEEVYLPVGHLGR